MFGIDDLIIGLIAAVVVDIIANIAKALAVKGAEEDVDELGDKVIQAEEAGISPDDFEKHDDYMEAIRDFKVDPERSKEISVEEKRAAGVNCIVSGIAEKAGINESAIGLIIKSMNKNEDFFKEFETGITKEFIANPKLLSDFAKFTSDDKVDFETYSRVLNTLAKVVKETNPQMSDNSAENKVMELRK